MISKDSFVKIMNVLQDYDAGLNALENALNVVMESSWMVNILDIVLDALVEDMEEEYTHPDGISPIVYDFAFASNWGREGKCLVEIDGERCCPTSAEELYELLVRIKERNNDGK